MTDELDLLRSFRSDIPGPSTDAWARARAAIALADPTASATDTAIPLRSHRHGSLRRRWRLSVEAAAAVVVVLGLLAGVGVIGGGGGLSRPLTTAWMPARAFAPPSSGNVTTRRGTWRLVDTLLTGTWQQNVYGPPPGEFSCAPDGTCYVLAGKYPSATAGAPLLSETLYVSTDQGATWSSLSVPSGLTPTTALECSGPQWCAAGGTYNGQPVLAVTRDGGHSFEIVPLPTGVGNLHQLTCPSTGVCMGLVATSKDPARLTATWLDATLLVTDDAGATFHDEQILAGASMLGLACTSRTDCTVVGMKNSSVHDTATNDTVTAGVSAVTTDQGQTWTAGSLPTGFGIRSASTSLSCADSQHCFVTGFVPIAPQYPPACASHLPKTTSTLPPMSPQAAAISRMETKIAAAAADQQSRSNGYGCNGNTVTHVSDVASTSNGGLTWTLDALPSDVPRPQLYGIACPTATECWTAGEQTVPRTVGNVTNAESPVILGTSNGGSTWSKVAFSIPSTAPNYTGQSYLTIERITCPSESVCLALGGAAQGSRYAPVYSLVEPVHSAG